MEGKSSLVIVPMAVAVPIVAPLVGLKRVTVKFSSGSKVVSPLMLTVITLEVSFAAKLTIPDGNAPPKSAASVGLFPVPVNVQLTSFVSVVAPDRVTVKVNALFPEFPSV
jgi:hypothetical protein